LSSFDLRDDSGGLGLIIMRERVDEAAGQLQIRTNKKGTELVATLPIPIPERTPRS
jgi:signal transduction histidine kinase